jgi:hypothetical protein
MASVPAQHYGRLYRTHGYEMYFFNVNGWQIKQSREWPVLERVVSPQESVVLDVERESAPPNTANLWFHLKSWESMPKPRELAGLQD